jgi:hypothetical protein
MDSDAKLTWHLSDFATYLALELKPIRGVPIGRGSNIRDMSHLHNPFAGACYHASCVILRHHCDPQFYVGPEALTADGLMGSCGR